MPIILGERRGLKLTHVPRSVVDCRELPDRGENI